MLGIRRILVGGCKATNMTYCSTRNRVSMRILGSLWESCRLCATLTAFHVIILYFPTGSSLFCPCAHTVNTWRQLLLETAWASEWSRLLGDPALKVWPILHLCYWPSHSHRLEWTYEKYLQYLQVVPLLGSALHRPATGPWCFVFAFLMLFTRTFL